MRLAFCLFKYFPYSGLARDFLKIATLCQERGHLIDVYTMDWRDEIPKGFNVTVMPVKHWLNHRRNKIFINKLKLILATQEYDLVMGFNKMPGLGLYFAADPCFIERFARIGKVFHRLSGRYKFYHDCERAVFGKGLNTVALLLSTHQKKAFKQFYSTPDERLRLLPPGIDKSRLRPDDAEQIRAEFRAKQGLSENNKVALMIGSAFKTKGLDRSLHALASLPDALKKRTFLYVIGEGDHKPFVRMAESLGVSKNLHFFFGQDDVVPFLLGADCLLQSSYSETAGMAILEAIISGLPVLATDVCGYAFHIERADVGRIAHSPFSLTEFTAFFEELLTSSRRQQWIANGIKYAKNEYLYSMVEQVVTIIEDLGKRQ